LIGARTEAEVEARGLILVVRDRPLGADPPVADRGAELVVGQDAVRHAAQPITRLTAPAVSTSNRRAAPAIPARRSAASIAAATGVSSPATLSGCPSARAARARSASFVRGEPRRALPATSPPTQAAALEPSPRAAGTRFVHSSAHPVNRRPAAS